MIKDINELIIEGDLKMNAYEEFMQSVYKPMREQLVANGFTELTTASEVEEKMEGLEGTAIIVINSVCGCAAGQARPAIIEAIQEAEHAPTHLLTVFAGQDKEATARMRDFFPEVEPSSPSIALWKDGKLAHFVPRDDIEINEKETIKAHLVEVFNQVVAK